MSFNCYICYCYFVLQYLPISGAGLSVTHTYRQQYWFTAWPDHLTVPLSPHHTPRSGRTGELPPWSHQPWHLLIHISKLTIQGKPCTYSFPANIVVCAKRLVTQSVRQRTAADSGEIHYAQYNSYTDSLYIRQQSHSLIYFVVWSCLCTQTQCWKKQPAM